MLSKKSLQPAGIQGFAQCWLLPGTCTGQTAQLKSIKLQTVLPHVLCLLLTDTAPLAHRDVTTIGCSLGLQQADSSSLTGKGCRAVLQGVSQDLCAFGKAALTAVTHPLHRG